jgi:hypothetical protein
MGGPVVRPATLDRGDGLAEGDAAPAVPDARRPRAISSANPTGGRFQSGPRARELAVATLSTMRVRTARLADDARACQGHRRDLQSSRSPTARRWSISTGSKRNGRCRVQFSEGTRVPLYCTASGKLYLSTLSDPEAGKLPAQRRSRGRWRRTPSPTREALRAETRDDPRGRGMLVDNEEFLDGVVAFAMPLQRQVRADAGDDLVPGAHATHVYREGVPTPSPTEAGGRGIVSAALTRFAGGHDNSRGAAGA